MTAKPILNTAEGLERLMGDEGLYRQVLLRFHKDYQQAVAQVRALLADGAQEAAQRKVHSMRGAAGMIGAQEVHRLAGEAESAKLGPDALDTLQAALDALLGAIAAHVDGTHAGAAADTMTASMASAAGPDRPADGTGDAQTLIARLARLLDEGNGEAIEVLEQSATALAASLGMAVFQEVAAAAHEFDYEAALAALRRHKPALSA